MTVTDRSKSVVKARLSELQTMYGELKRVEKTWKFAPAAYERFAERVEAGTIGGAGVWITNDAGEVLLVRNEGDDAWSDPGGKVEADESMADAAVREVREETGVTCVIEGLRQVQLTQIVEDSSNPQPPIHDIIALFDGRYVEGEPTAAPGEIAAVQWWDHHPRRLLYDELADFPIPAVEA